MPLTISRVVGVVEFDEISSETFSGIPRQLEALPQGGREASLPAQRAKLGGAVPIIHLDANIKRLLAQLEHELQIVEQCLKCSMQTPRS